MGSTTYIYRAANYMKVIVKKYAGCYSSKTDSLTMNLMPSSAEYSLHPPMKLFVPPPP